MLELGQVLARVRNRLRAVRWARWALLFLVALVAPLPLVLFAVAAGLPWLLGWLGWLVAAFLLFYRPLLSPRAVSASRADIPLAARTLEGSDTFLGDELSSAAELLDSPNPFARLQVRRAERLLAAAKPDLGDVWRSELRRPLTGALGALLVFGLGVLIGPGSYDLGWRGMLGADTSPPVPRLIEVEPGNLEIAPGSRVTVRALFDHPPRAPVLRHRPLSGGPWRETALEPVDDPLVFAAALPPLEEPLEYQVLHAAGAGERYALTLLPSPRLSGLRLKITPPAYTGLPPRELPPGEGNVIAPVGSRIGLEALATPELSAAGLEFEESPAVPVEPLPLAAGSRLATSFTLRRSEGWNLRLTAANGLESATPRYRLVALPDEPPTIVLDEPGGAVDLDITMTVPLSARVADDYGVSSLSLVYSRRGEGGGVGEPERLVIARNLGLVARVDYRWNLTGVDLLPGEELLCRLEVTDNDAFAGPKTVPSAGFVVRYPGIEEIVEGETFAGPLDSLEELGEREERLAQRMEELAREHRGEERVGSEEQRQLRRLMDEQAEAVARAEEVVRRLEDTLNTLYEKNLITPESFAKLSEVQGLLEKVLDERLKEQLASLQRAVENLDRAEIERLAAQFNQTRQEFERSLDRMLELLRRAEAEQRLTELVERAAEASERSGEILEEPNPEDASDQAGEIESLSEEAETVREALSELATVDEDLGRAAEEVGEAAAELAESGAAELSSQAAESLQAGESRSARGMLGQTSQSLGQFHQSLAGTLAELRSSQHRKLLEMIAAQVNALILLSRYQEQVVGLIAGPGSAERSGEIGRRLASISAGVRRVAVNLEDVYRQTVYLDSDLLDQLEQLAVSLDSSAAEIAAGERPNASLTGRQLATLTAVGLKLLEIQGQAMSAASSTGMSELMAALGELAARQQGVNQQTMQGAGGMPMPMPGGFNLAQLAARQAAIQQGLGELAQKYGEMEGMLGDIGEMASQAGGIEELLREGRLGEPTQQEQQQLLRRMLDAQRSLNEEELSRRRESQQARPYTVQPPPPLEVERPEDFGELRPADSRLEIGMFPPEYRQAIEEYLRRLGE
ncbi:MAG TPA: hypothetical protein VM054_01840 [bacterium]|nr:hypothetical protein [bacterium]